MSRREACTSGRTKVPGRNSADMASDRKDVDAAVIKIWWAGTQIESVSSARDPASNRVMKRHAGFLPVLVLGLGLAVCPAAAGSQTQPGPAKTQKKVVSKENYLPPTIAQATFNKEPES